MSEETLLLQSDRFRTGTLFYGFSTPRVVVPGPVNKLDIVCPYDLILAKRVVHFKLVAPHVSFSASTSGVSAVAGQGEGTSLEVVGHVEYKKPHVSLINGHLETRVGPGDFYSVVFRPSSKMWTKSVLLRGHDFKIILSRQGGLFKVQNNDEVVDHTGMDADVWHCISLYIENKKTFIYIDGALQSIEAPPVMVLSTPTYKMLVGGKARPFVGNVIEVYV